MENRKNRRYALSSNKFLLPNECSQLWKILEVYKTTQLREILLLELALETGARASEILSIKNSDINDHDKSVFLLGLKGSNDREIPLKDDLFGRLKIWQEMTCKNAADTDLLFQIGYDRFRQIWQLYRPVKKPLHCLRHTFAINLFRRTRDLRLVQLALGHRNITNTMIYADYVYSKTEMRRLIVEI